MPKSEFLGRHLKCDACDKEVEGRSDHNDLFKGWSEIQRFDISSNSQHRLTALDACGRPQYKVLCPTCSELHDITIAELFQWPDPTNQPIKQLKARLVIKLPKHACQRCGLVYPDGKGIKLATKSAGEWKNHRLCTNCRVELNELHIKGVTCVPAEPSSSIGELLKEKLSKEEEEERSRSELLNYSGL